MSEQSQNQITETHLIVFVEWTDCPFHSPETGLHFCGGHFDPHHRGVRDPPLHRGQDQTHVPRDHAGEPNLRLGRRRRSVSHRKLVSSTLASSL